MVVDSTNRESVNELFGFGKKKKEEKKAEKKEPAADKQFEEYYSNHPLVKKSYKEIGAFGEKLGKAVANYVKKYAKDNKFSEKYPMFDINAVEYDPVADFDVKITDYQCGWNDTVIDKWEEANPGKDWMDSKDPELNMDWYNKLLTEGEEAAKRIFKEFDKDDKYKLYTGTGDGDEGHIYIAVELNGEHTKELRAEVKKDYEDSKTKGNVNESVEPVNEVFGLSKKEKEEKAANRKALSDLEFSYDKKFNAFCLSVSSYSVDKLQSMLDKKSAELESAKDEKKSASDRQKKLEAQVKIDYLENVCNRCKAMIKKKKSYEKK